MDANQIFILCMAAFGWLSLGLLIAVLVGGEWKNGLCRLERRHYWLLLGISIFWPVLAVGHLVYLFVKHFILPPE